MMKQNILNSKNFYFYIVTIFNIYFIIYSLLELCYPVAALSESNSFQIQRIAISRFQINSQQDISYIKNGISQMLSSRLAWKNKIIAVSEEFTKAKAILKEAVSTENITDSSIEKKNDNTASHFDYVIKGSITEFAGAFSIDATVYNINSNTSRAFFTQAETPEKIIPSIEILSAKINKDIFNRETLNFALIHENKKKESIDNIRANPEKLMQLASFEQNRNDTKPPFWKFWKKENLDKSSGNTSNSLETNLTLKNPSPNNSEEKIEFGSQINSYEEENDDEKDKKPFWKFW